MKLAGAIVRSQMPEVFDDDQMLFAVLVHAVLTACHRHAVPPTGSLTCRRARSTPWFSGTDPEDEAVLWELIIDQEAWVTGDHHYGTDETDEFDTLAEATEQPDGTFHYEVVQIDKRTQEAK